MSRAVLSLGSNLDEPLDHLRAAARGLEAWTLARSPIYSTRPWGPVPQPDYLNAVIITADDAADAGAWLRLAHELETAAGRTRRQRWGARTLDVDVITVDGVRSDDEELTLPHPRAAQRAFVLVPWLAADPRADLPGSGPVATLVRTLPRADIDGVRERPDLEWG